MKSCPYCGATMTDDVLICPNCGRPADGSPAYSQPPYEPQPAQQPYSQPANQPYQQPYQQPYGQQPYAQPVNQQYQPPYGQPYYPTAPENSVMAVLALIFAFVEPIIGIILGAIGLSKLHEPKNRTMCKAGVIISIVRIVLVIILMIIAFAGAGMNSYM